MSEQGEKVELSEVEQEAHRQGWRPLEEWGGPEDEWVDAETFVRRGREINPILKKTNDRLTAELRKRDAELAEVKATVAEFGELYKKMSETAYARAIADVKRQLKDARKEGDDDLSSDLEEQLEGLKEDAKNIKVPSAPKSQEPDRAAALAAFESWKGDNSWYGGDRTLTRLADGIALQLQKEQPSLVGTREFLDRVTEQVKEEMPEKFTNKRRANGSPVSGSIGRSSTSSSSKGGKTYADLPPEAKAACDRMTTEGRPGYIKGFTKEKYVSTFFEE